MNLKKLLKTYPELLKHMKDDGYTTEYIKRIEWEIKWLRRTRSKYHFVSYQDMFHTRVETGRKKVCSEGRAYHLRSMYAILQRFEEDGVFPDRRKRRPLTPRGSYFKLLPIFQEVIDTYKAYAEEAGLKESTIKKRLSKGSRFLLFMQERGHRTLATISEDDVMSFFVDSNGMVILSSTHKKEILSIFRAELGIHTESARRIVTYLPDIKKRKKNIKYLTPEESEMIRDCLYDTGNHFRRW